MTVRAATMALAAVLVAVLFASVSGLGTGAQSLIVGIDAGVSENTPRSVLDIDDCASTAAGETIEVDVVVPAPGIPGDRGLTGYQFRLFYDPQIVHVIEDNGEMLLDQAPGSALVPLADPKPNTSGIYFSSVVDFGASGIEPGGSSETGPGVLGRVTLEALQQGMTPLVIRDVILKDDSGNDIEVDSIQAARIHVDEPCPGLAATPTPTPATAAQDPTSTPTTSPGTPTPTPQLDAGGSAPSGTNGSPADAGEIVTAGGPPGARDASGLLTVVLGSVLMASGVAAAAVGFQRSRRSR